MKNEAREEMDGLGTLSRIAGGAEAQGGRQRSSRDALGGGRSPSSLEIMGTWVGAPCSPHNTALLISEHTGTHVVVLHQQTLKMPTREPSQF